MRVRFAHRPWAHLHTLMWGNAPREKSRVGGRIEGRTRRGKLHRSSMANARYGHCIGIHRDGCRVWSKCGYPSNCACFWSGFLPLCTVHDCNFTVSVAALEWVTLEGWVMFPAPYRWKSEGHEEGGWGCGIPQTLAPITLYGKIPLGFYALIAFAYIPHL